MRFNSRSNLAGQHAFLSPSSYHWINYDDDKLDLRFKTAMTARRGTEMHDLANQCIKLGVKLPSTRKTINLYVNDAIGYRMSSEQILYYSDNCFGTADTIAFRNNVLRIHDLKNGVSITSEHQLEVYAALFCLEYAVSPFEISSIEMRIYQNDEVRVYIADPEDIARIMDTIVAFDKRINTLRLEADL